MADQTMDILFELITIGLTTSFDDQMKAYIDQLETLKSNQVFLQFLHSPNPAFFQSSEPGSLTNQMVWVACRLQNIVPTFVKEMKRWKWSEMAHPTRTKEENAKLLRDTTDWFQKLLEGIELLLNVAQLCANNPVLNFVNTLQNFKCDLVENALIVHVQPIDSCTHEQPCKIKKCALNPIQAIKEDTNFGVGVKFLADPCEIVGDGSAAEAGSIKKVKGKRKIQEQDEGQGQGQRTFKIFILTENEAAELHQSWKGYEEQKENQNQIPNQNLLNSNLAPVQNLVRDSVRNFMTKTKKHITVKGNEYNFTLKIKPIHKPDGRGPTVKSVLLITTTVNIFNPSLGQYQDVEVWTTSLPVVYIKNRTQECPATATFFWDNCFQEKDRIPFQVMENVPWDLFKEGVDSFFKYATGTSRGLNNDDLTYFGGKIFPKNRNFEAENAVVNRVEFCACKYNNKKNMYELNPWTWLYHIIKLIADHLKQNWENGKIVGYIDRTEAEGFLTVQGPGAFLFRFSDTKLGGISVSACTATGISSVAPIYSEDLKKRSIEQRLRDLNNCQTVIALDVPNQTYVAIPKEAAFVIPPPPEPEPAENGNGPQGRKPYDPSELTMQVIGTMSNLNIQSPAYSNHSPNLTPTPSPNPSQNPSPIPSPAPFQYNQMPSPSATVPVSPASPQSASAAQSPFIHGHLEASGYGQASPGYLYPHSPNPMQNYVNSPSPTSSYYCDSASQSPGYINSQVPSPMPMPMQEQVPMQMSMPMSNNMEMADYQVPGNTNNFSLAVPMSSIGQQMDYPMDQDLYPSYQNPPKY